MQATELFVTTSIKMHAPSITLTHSSHSHAVNTLCTPGRAGRAISSASASASASGRQRGGPSWDDRRAAWAKTGIIGLREAFGGTDGMAGELPDDVFGEVIVVPPLGAVGGGSSDGGQGGGAADGGGRGVDGVASSSSSSSVPGPSSDGRWAASSGCRTADLSFNRLSRLPASLAALSNLSSLRWVCGC